MKFGILLLLLIASCWLVSWETVANAYHQYIFPTIAQFKACIFGFIHFSIGDILWPILIAMLIYGVVHTLKGRSKFIKKVSQLILGCFAIYFIFLINWGINYHKSPLSTQVKKTTWSKAQLEELNQSLIDSINTLAHFKRESNIKAINSQLKDVYIQYLGKNGECVHVKYSLWSFLINRMQTSGYYNPLTGEAQIVNDLPDCMYPYLAAHEMAHQVGIAAEDDANFMAYIICVQSPNKSFRYSAFLNLYLYTRSELFYQDTSSLRKGFAQLDTLVKLDLLALRKHAQKYKGKLGKTSMQLYNEYLKMNGLPKGIDTYDEVTRWVYEWEKEGRPKIAP